MNQTDVHVDVKAYALGEMSESEKRSAGAHVAKCDGCREELAEMQVTLNALRTVRDEEMPRRIAFVSDKVFEPRWWQRMLNPMFASACVLAAAIVFHAVSNQGPSEAEMQARIDQAVTAEVEREMADRLMVFDQMNKRAMEAYKATAGLVSY